MYCKIEFEIWQFCNHNMKSVAKLKIGLFLKVNLKNKH